MDECMENRNMIKNSNMNKKAAAGPFEDAFRYACMFEDMARRCKSNDTGRQRLFRAAAYLFARHADASDEHTTTVRLLGRALLDAEKAGDSVLIRKIERMMESVSVMAELGKIRRGSNLRESARIRVPLP